MVRAWVSDDRQVLINCSDWGNGYITQVFGALPKFHNCARCVELFQLAKHVIFPKSFKYSAIQNVLSMAMSKKDMVRRSSKKRAVLDELEKQAVSGSGDAKKKLAKAKKKMK